MTVYCERLDKSDMKKTEITDGMQDYWGVRSESYSRQNIEELNDWRREAWKKKILAQAPQKEVLDILDVGTGPGFFAIDLALVGHRVCAVDLTKEMLDHAGQNAKAYGATVDFRQSAADSLPFADASFDLVVSRNVTWALETPEEALKEWKRVLRPEGRILYFDANWNLYLFDEELAGKKKENRRRVEEKYPDCSSHGGQMPKEKLDLLERLSYRLPLSRVHRPQWDVDTLPVLGLKVVALQADIAREVLTEREAMEYRLTPMFMVCAQKGDEAY